MVSLCQMELYFVVLYWTKAPSSNEMIAVKLLLKEDAQIQ